MNTRTLLPLFSAFPLLLTGCGEEPATAEPGEPETPEGMYAKSQELLKPSVEREGPDVQNSMLWLIRAAKAGHRQAQCDLGGIYFRGGKGVEADPAEALKWFNLAAEQGDAQALVFAGDIYFFGYAGAADRDKGLELWRKAAAAGVVEAEYCLGNALVRYYKDSVPEGVEHLQKAAAGIQGSLGAKSALMLAGIYFKGYGPVPQDTAAGVEWYRRAADAGSPEGQLIYGLMLVDGGYVPADAAKGLAYLRLSAGQDHLPAITALIDYLRNAPAATPEMEAEAEAWQKRLGELQAAH